MPEQAGSDDTTAQRCYCGSAHLGTKTGDSVAQAPSCEGNLVSFCNLCQTEEAKLQIIMTKTTAKKKDTGKQRGRGGGGGGGAEQDWIQLHVFPEVGWGKWDINFLGNSCHP